MEIGAEIAIGIAAGMMMGYAGIYLMRGMMGELAGAKKNSKNEVEGRVDRRGRLRAGVTILDAEILEEAGSEKN